MHRDLKPDNVLFVDNDSLDVVISDIGLSQDVSYIIYISIFIIFIIG